MKVQQRLLIANIIMIVSVVFVWLAGIRGTAIIAVGSTTFGFATLFPEYKYERGVWMAGLLLMPITAFCIFIAFVDLFGTDVTDKAAHFVYATIASVIGIALLFLFFAFTVYASAVNYRLSRTSKRLLANEPNES